jgi:predicted nucleotide-binding protein (sugar kinase/HSP70/actin superfamily)
MGNAYIPLKTFFEQLNVSVVVPPKCSKKTLELGVKYSPEFACLPLKINIGNFIEALEIGADTIVMAGGIGPCRFGYYGEVQREILTNLGYKFDMIILEPPKGHFLEVVGKFMSLINKSENTIRDLINAGKLAWQKAILLDELEKMACETRPIQVENNCTDDVYRSAVNLIEHAWTEDDIINVDKKIRQMFSEISCKKRAATTKIAIVGEIYTVLEPFVNQNIEIELGKLGAVVHRSIYITDWVKENLFPSFLKPKNHKEILKLAKPYINCFVGGHGQETVAQTIKYSKEGYQGIIHLLPFTCMPEIVAKSVLPHISRNNEIPVMTLVLDEHSAETGLKTRLEAFIDMINYKQEADLDEMLARN